MSSAKGATLKVVHLTTAPLRHERRIVMRVCRLLAQHGYEVTLLVADGQGQGPAMDNGVCVQDLGHAVRELCEQAIALAADIYHLHDAALIPAGLRLKRLGHSVVFHAHGALAPDISSMPWPARLVAAPLAAAVGAWRRRACTRFDAILAGGTLRDRFAAIHPATLNLDDYPDPDETLPAPWIGKARQLCAVGPFAHDSGLRELMVACQRLSSAPRMVLAGRFGHGALEAELRGMHGWAQVDLAACKQPAADTMGRSLAGLATFHPTAANCAGVPAILFEYMAAGIPVIASAIPQWRELIERHDCGLCVDPFDPAAIAATIDTLVEHPLRAQAMGMNGRRAIEQHYNWQREGRSLLALYDELKDARRGSTGTASAAQRQPAVAAPERGTGR